MTDTDKNTDENTGTNTDATTDAMADGQATLVNDTVNPTETPETPETAPTADYSDTADNNDSIKPKRTKTNKAVSATYKTHTLVGNVFSPTYELDSADNPAYTEGDKVKLNVGGSTITGEFLTFTGDQNSRIVLRNVTNTKS